MAYKVLYRKYRPTNFNELVGQKPIKEALTNAIIKNQLSHAYIFTGPRGTGKTSMAKIFAKALTCQNPVNGICCNNCSNCLSFNENPDIIEIDAASNNGVDEIREIRNNVKLVPTMSKYKIYIVDEVHMLSNSAWNAFLKTLEEPPSHVIFIFATTDIQKVPVTVLSRCQRYDFHKINKENIYKHVNYIAQEEGFKINDDAIYEIIKLSDGCLRDCLSYLDQLSKVNSVIDLQLVSEVFGITSLNYINELLTSIENNQLEKFLLEFKKIEDDGIDCNILINNISDYLLDEAIKIKKSIQSNLKNFNFCYKLIKELMEFQKGIKYIDNPYRTLKILLLDYFDESSDSNTNENKKLVASKKIETEEKIISREIILESNDKNISQTNRKIENKDKELGNDDKFFEQLKPIRINNVFCGANKNLKISFSDKWKIFLDKINDLNDYTLLGYVSNMTIEVVSDSYVLFSTKLSSDSVIFNSNLSLIEKQYETIMNIPYKFIALDSGEWEKEKAAFIKNKDIERKLIDENVLQSEAESVDKSLSFAQDIFGDIIEVN